MDVHLQWAYERVGAAAGLIGKTRADCPYDREKEPGPWNHWVYGCENAAGELATLRSGVVDFYYADRFEKSHSLPVEEAIATGQWKPQWVTLDMRE
jgi:ribosome modulation factor